MCDHERIFGAIQLGVSKNYDHLRQSTISEQRSDLHESVCNKQHHILGLKRKRPPTEAASD
jgi:hypothetical protein